jgi:hypothetical protein
MKTSTINNFFKVAVTAALLLASSKLMASEMATDCMTSSSQKIAAEFIGGWRDTNTTNLKSILVISSNGEINILPDNGIMTDLLPEPFGYLQAKPNGDIGFKYSCEFIQYLKSQGKTDADVAKEIKDAESNLAKITNGELVTYSVQSVQIYKKVSEEEVIALKKERQIKKAQVKKLKESNFRPLVGKKFKLVNRISNGFYTDGKAYSLTQQASELQSEYNCGTDMCLNTKNLQVISLNESIVNDSVKATNSVYLKESFSGFDGYTSDLVGISVEQKQNSSYLTLTGEFIYSPGALKVIQLYTLKDGKTFEVINNFIEVQ